MRLFFFFFFVRGAKKGRTALLDIRFSTVGTQNVIAVSQETLRRRKNVVVTHHADSFKLKKEVQEKKTTLSIQIGISMENVLLTFHLHIGKQGQVGQRCVLF